jgi:hypothetical protein
MLRTLILPSTSSHCGYTAQVLINELHALTNSTYNIAHTYALFVWLISHQPAVLFSQNKSATSNQPTVLFSQNKSAPAISYQPNELVGEEGDRIRSTPLAHRLSSRQPSHCSHTYSYPVIPDLSLLFSSTQEKVEAFTSTYCT